MQASLHPSTAARGRSNEASAQTAADSAPAPARAGLQTLQLMPVPEAASLPAAVAASSQRAWPEGNDAGEQNHPLDVDDLAQKVYRQLRRRLLLEWERLRPGRD